MGGVEAAELEGEDAGVGGGADVGDDALPVDRAVEGGLMLVARAIVIVEMEGHEAVEVLLEVVETAGGKAIDADVAVSAVVAETHEVGRVLAEEAGEQLEGVASHVFKGQGDAEGLADGQDLIERAAEGIECAQDPGALLGGGIGAEEGDVHHEGAFAIEEAEHADAVEDELDAGASVGFVGPRPAAPGFAGGAMDVEEVKPGLAQDGGNAGNLPIGVVMGGIPLVAPVKVREAGGGDEAQGFIGYVLRAAKIGGDSEGRGHGVAGYGFFWGARGAAARRKGR